jgi:hypothetical protein
MATACTATQGGSSAKREKVVSTNAIYHWKGVFSPTAEEYAFMQDHEIGRLYIRFFDIAAEYDNVNQRMEAVPIATTRFDGGIPYGVEVIPVTYITLDGLRQMTDRESYYASIIVERMLAMASYNELGEIKEIQFDCDWTESTRHIFFALCECARLQLHDMDMTLSVTVRLHQLRQQAPTADRGVLMLYNTGAVRNPNTRNSILNINDVEPYLKRCKYRLPLDYAYPSFGWSVLFKDGIFQRLISDNDNYTPADGETLRVERASAEDVVEVKRRVERAFGKPYQSNIIYHLDINQLNNYTDDEIAEIFARN